MVLVTEVEEGKRWDEAKLKKMTGGDTLTARLMRQDFFEFKPQFKPQISGNHKPQIKSVDVAMRRRINLVPFSVTIPPEKRDNQLKNKLREEWPGILQWQIEGCLEYQRMGLAPPQSVVDATDLYFKDEDTVASWIEERCEVGKGLKDSATRLFASWKHYAEKAGLFAGNNKRFKAEMNRLGYRDKRLSFGVVYEGLSLRPDDPGLQPGGRGRGNYDPDHLDPF
jgi:putative DNA primase/helicase